VKKGTVNRSLILGVMLSGNGFVAEPALAQQAPADEDAAIVVTANKRTQDLRDVPLTVAVLGADSLAEKQISTLADIAAAIPGLSFSSSENNTPVFTLRGIGFNEASLSAYPTVSVYVDEAPLPFPVLAAQGAYDLERVEVLKGPQGTLFGQNSTGGAINYIAAKPTDEFAGGGSVSLGRFATTEADGFLSGPLTDTLQARAAFHYARSDDWQYSYTRRDTIGETNVLAGRLLLKWEPTDTLRLQMNINGWQDKSDPAAGQLVGVAFNIPYFDSSQNNLLNYPFAPNNPRAADWTPDGVVAPNGEVVDFRPRSDRSQVQGYLRGDLDLGSDVTLTSLTSWIKYDQKQVTDYDGIALNDTDLSRNDGSIDTFFQEIRASNGSHGQLRWTVGANYQYSDVKEQNVIRYHDSTEFIPALGFLLGNSFEGLTKRKDFAVFGNTEFDLTPKLTLQAGARYTNNRTAETICNRDLGDGRIKILVETLSQVLTGTPITIAPDSCVSLNFDFVPGQPYRQVLKEDNVSWRGGLQYKFSRDLMTYANISRGYKAGSFPTVSASSWNQLVPVTQESVTAYEVGVKSGLLDRRVTFNAAAFYYDYKDKQIRGKILDPVFGVLNALVNVPKSRIWGLEAEVSVRPATGLTIAGSATYLNSKVTNYVGTSVSGETADFAGDRIPFTPEWQGTLDVDYRFDMGTVRPFFGTTVSARTDTTSYIVPDDYTIAPKLGVRLAEPGGNPFAFAVTRRSICVRALRTSMPAGA